MRDGDREQPLWFLLRPVAPAGQSSVSALKSREKNLNAIRDNHHISFKEIEISTRREDFLTS